MVVPKLRFKEFDGDWSIKSLSELANLTSSKRVHLADYVPDGIPFFRGKEITALKSGVFPSDILYISHNQFNEFKEKYGVPKNNEILITAVGTLANTYLVNTNYDFYFKDGNLIWLKDIKADPKFMMILLDAKKNDVLASAIGSTQKALTIANLNKLIFNFPSKEEQTKIASFLSTVDEKISQLTQKHELLSQYKQGMMQKLFSQQLRFKADDGSEFGEWEEISANELFENYSNKDHDGTLTILAATQDKGIVPRDEIDIDIKSSDASVLSYKIIEKGSFVISLRSFQGGIEYSNYYGICSPAYTILRSLRPIASEFYKNYLKTNDFIQRLSATVVGIRDGKQISYQAFSTLNIDYPSVEEQTKIANFLSAIDQKIEVVAQQIEQAKQWKKGLLQQMFV